MEKIYVIFNMNNEIHGFTRDLPGWAAKRGLHLVEGRDGCGSLCHGPGVWTPRYGYCPALCVD